MSIFYRKRTILQFHPQCPAFNYISTDYGAGNSGFKFALQITLERTCAINRVIPGFSNKAQCFLTYFKSYALIFQALLELRCKEVGNFLDLINMQRFKKYNVIDAI